MKLTLVEQQEIFEHDKFFNQCHASTILKHGDRLLCAWFAGTRESHDDVRIYLSSNENGSWSEPRQMSFTDDIPCWNPVLFEHDGVIELYYKVGKTIPDWQTWLRTSADGGITWSEARELVSGDVSGGRGPVKNKPILLSDGRIAAPASVETKTQWDAFVDLSSDGGKTWQKSKLMGFDHSSAFGNGVIQPTLWETNGKIHAFLRSSESSVMMSESSDGINWSDCKKTTLPNNNSGIDCAKINDRDVILICNPISGEWAARNTIAYVVTSDNGAIFSEPTVIEHDENDKAEFSYPAVISDSEYVYITYTHYRKSVMFVKYKIEK